MTTETIFQAATGAMPLPAALPQDENQLDVSALLQEAVEELRRWFEVDFSIFDDVGLSRSAGSTLPVGDQDVIGQLTRAAAHHDDAQFLAEEEGVVLLALPCEIHREHVVAVAAFATARTEEIGDLDKPARLLGLDTAEVRQWFDRQSVWDPQVLLRLGNAVLGKMSSEARARRLEEEVEKVSQNLSSTYEEISLLYGVTQNLRLSKSDQQLYELALDWLIECVGAEAVMAQLLPVADVASVTYDARTEPVMLSVGDAPLNDAQFDHLIASLQLGPQSGPTVINQNVTADANWNFSTVRELVVIPLCEGENLFGWLAAINREGGGEFGTVEASLLSSVGAVLGIHSGNHELYRQQAEFMANVVKALTSAIDAKDPYTCGHSDRVARISVRLAQQLGCDEETLGTLYMGGLLHDIGKIGIEDRVLRKPGRLTEAEYEQIKMHPELGYKILADLQQFEAVLPVVLHHHEQWDGNGYPHGLAGDEIPFLARIAAVADAYDAMSSDRPYRDGMPLEKVEKIFRAGSGQQWDANVIDAYFAARDDILEISRRERANLTVNVQQWT